MFGRNKGNNTMDTELEICYPVDKPTGTIPLVINKTHQIDELEVDDKNLADRH